MTDAVDFNTLSTVGLESSPVTAALAGLRANEARYFKNKYDHVFTVEPASDARPTISSVHRILKQERDIVISSRPLEASAFQIENIRMAYVFYESGLSINVMYTVDDPDKRAVGFKLSKGMEVPARGGVFAAIRDDRHLFEQVRVKPDSRTRPRLRLGSDRPPPERRGPSPPGLRRSTVSRTAVRPPQDAPR